MSQYWPSEDAIRRLHDLENDSIGREYLDIERMLLAWGLTDILQVPNPADYRMRGHPQHHRFIVGYPLSMSLSQFNVENACEAVRFRYREATGKILP